VTATETERVWHGSAELETLLVPVDTLVRHPRNPRRGQIQLIAESLDRFGQVRPILTDGTQIIAGNHTYLAALELGFTHVAAIRNDFETEEEARAYLLADNRLPELGGYDEAQLLDQLAELEASGHWEGTGYTADDLDDLRAMQDAIPTTALAEFQGDYAVTPEELAARAQTLAGGRTLSEVVLLLTEDQAADFEAHTKILAKEYGGVGVTDTVFTAIAAAAARD
jgi:hypothetical protein